MGGALGNDGVAPGRPGPYGLDPWGLLPDPEAVAANETGSGRYRGRRRNRRSRRRGAAALGTAAVVAAVGLVLVGSGVLANYFSEPVLLPVVPPSPPVPTAEPSLPVPVSRLGPAPSPTTSPTPSPSPSPAPPPAAPDPPPQPPPPPPAPPAPPEPEPVSLEAEDAARAGNTEREDLESASGDELVRIFGGCECNVVSFTDVTVERAGQYQLTIRHGRLRSEDRFDRLARVVVNGGEPIMVFLPSPRRGEVESVNVPIELRSGANTIQITGVQDVAGPGLDLITIQE